MENAVLISNEFKSQMTFLKVYQQQFEERSEILNKLEMQLEGLKPMVDKYTNLKEKIDELKKEIRSDEKFLVSMNDMIIRATGQPISNGPIFDGDPEANS